MPLSKAEIAARQIRTALALPAVVDEAMKLSAQPQCDSRRLADVISKDPVLASKLLQLSNSAFFGFSTPTASIGEAITRLGFPRVRSLAMSISVGKLFAGAVPRGDGYTRLNVWRHSVAVGLLGELLARASPLPAARELTGQALLTGLIHDLGMILIEQHTHGRYAELAESAQASGVPVHELEHRKFGYDHMALAAVILTKWRFPGPIILAVANHHMTTNPDTGDPLSLLAALAEYMGHRVDVGYSDIPGIPDESIKNVCGRLNISEPDLDTVRDSFDEQIGGALKIFAVSE